MPLVAALSVADESAGADELEVEPTGAGVEGADAVPLELLPDADWELLPDPDWDGGGDGVELAVVVGGAGVVPVSGSMYC